MNRDQQIAERLRDMPPKYRATYRRAVKGNSLRASTVSVWSASAGSLLRLPDVPIRVALCSLYDRTKTAQEMPRTGSSRVRKARTGRRARKWSNRAPLSFWKFV
jgi:hypothetical protein